MLWQINNTISSESENDVLIDAIKNLKYRQASLLVESGTNVNTRDRCGRTPLMLISMYFTGSDNWQNRVKFAKLLLSANADPNLTDVYGLTPLMHASINGHVDYVTVLLAHENTNYELCDKGGNDAIMLAARYGRVEVLQEFKQFLIHNGTDIYILNNVNHKNKSAIDIAHEYKQYECASLLTTLKSALIDKKIMSETTKSAENIVDVKLVNGAPLEVLSNPIKINYGVKSQLIYGNKLNDKCAPNCVKLPTLYGNRFVGYNEWEQTKQERKTL